MCPVSAEEPATRDAAEKDLSMLEPVLTDDEEPEASRTGSNDSVLFDVSFSPEGKPAKDKDSSTELTNGHSITSNLKDKKEEHENKEPPNGLYCDIPHSPELRDSPISPTSDERLRSYTAQLMLKLNDIIGEPKELVIEQPLKISCDQDSVNHNGSKNDLVSPITRRHSPRGEGLNGLTSRRHSPRGGDTRHSPRQQLNGNYKSCDLHHVTSHVT